MPDAANLAPPRQGLPGRALGRARRAAARLGGGLASLGDSAAARLRAVALARPGLLVAPFGAARRLWPGRRDLAAAEALLVARARGWPAAAPLLAGLAAPEPPLAGGAAHALLRPDAPHPAGPLAIPADRRRAGAPAEPAAAESAREVVVATAILGRPRPLLPVFGAPAGVRLVCFTDLDLPAVPGWQRVPPPPLPEGVAPELLAAWLKIRTPEALAAAGIAAAASLWIDPDRWLVGNLDTLVSRWLAGQALALWRHPAGRWPAMAERHLVAGTAPAAAVAEQAGRLAADALPEAGGACDTGMVWRRHGAPTDAFDAAWWRAFAAAPGADDLALFRALADPAAPLAAAAAPPAILPERLGAAGDNVFLVRTGRAPVARRRPPAAGRRLPVVFLSAPAHAASASTLLRGHQLAALVAAAFPDRYAVRVTEDASAVRDAAVVLTKGAMATLAPEAITALGRRNLATIGAWDDIRPDPRKAELVDATMTLSYRQTVELNRLYPRAPSFLVTHHVNTQIGAVTPPVDRLRTGYFGDLENTARPASLAGMVELVGIDTRNVEERSSWVAALPRFNCHWIVRRARPWDGWKPFLKGFVAARCGAAVITTADDGDAPYYLGDDYPFYARSLGRADLEMAMVETAAAFGGPDWRLALAIMAEVAARSTDAQVCAEFRLMIDEVAG